MLPGLPEDWWKALSAEFTKPYFSALCERLEEEYKSHTIYPPREDLFSAFRETPVNEVKVVILGQDPYHEPGQAMGMSFSVRPGVKVPPSLQNIYKEIGDEYGVDPGPMMASGDLTRWAEQGVLLLNTVLTVRAGQAGSMRGIGWETFTDAVINFVDRLDQPVVFLLWGRDARAKAPMLRHKNHLTLECPHPSPFSARYGFFGCGHFKKANEYLTAHDAAPVEWVMTD